MNRSLTRYFRLEQKEELLSAPKDDWGSQKWLFTCGGYVINKRCILWIILGGCIYVPVLIWLFNKVFRMVDIDYSRSGFLINTHGCHILDLNPFDLRLANYFKDADPINCNKSGLPSLVRATMTYKLIIDMSVAHLYTDEPFLCCYRPFSRLETPKNVTIEMGNLTYPKAVDSSILHGKSCYNINGSAVVTEEFVTVICYTMKKQIFKDLFAFPKNPYNLLDPEFKNGVDSDNLSVLIIGFDGMSRLNFIRQMPRTLNFLEEHDVVSLRGYNKVGDNTLPNLVPLLTGYSEESLKKVCWPNELSVFDNCTFLWDLFKKQGYVTAFGEDGAPLGTFTYQKRGFRKKPADFYPRTFDLLSVKTLRRYKKMNYNICLGDRFASKIFNDLIKSFVYSMRHQLTFGFFWGNTLSHDFLNLQKIGDVDFLDLLIFMDELGIFNHTILVVMSDHGQRWGSFRRTLQGLLEARLPFVHFLFPKWFHKKYSSAFANLKINRERLTTPFDIHETIKDILDLSKISNREIDLYTDQQDRRNGTSLFRPISTNRTCNKAGIPDEYCACHNLVSVSPKSGTVREAAHKAVDHLNNLLRNHSQCAVLNFSAVVNGRILEVVEDNTEDRLKTLPDNLFNDYVISFNTTPGGGLFEATVRHKMNSVFSVIGKISRMNMYSNQSRCMPSYSLKVYCYCINSTAV